MAFAYFKIAKHADVFYWADDALRLAKLDWCQDMDIEVAKARCNDIQVLECIISNYKCLIIIH